MTGPQMIKLMIDHLAEKAIEEVGAPDGLREEICLLMAVFSSARDWVADGAKDARRQAVGKTKKKDMTAEQRKQLDGIEKHLERLQHAVATDVINRLEALVSRNRFDWMSRN
jgi:hypothetical protein